MEEQREDVKGCEIINFLHKVFEFGRFNSRLYASFILSEQPVPPGDLSPLSLPHIETNTFRNNAFTMCSRWVVRKCPEGR